MRSVPFSEHKLNVMELFLWSELDSAPIIEINVNARPDGRARAFGPGRVNYLPIGQVQKSSAVRANENRGPFSLRGAHKLIRRPAYVHFHGRKMYALCPPSPAAARRQKKKTPCVFGRHAATRDV